MQLTKRFEISRKENISQFLNSEFVGRICTIDGNGYPQIIPMNFVFVPSKTLLDLSNGQLITDAIYMHSHPFGEKIENIRRNPKVGFEVDRHISFLPSYYFHPTDASQADTLYISVVIKGRGYLIEDNQEKAIALNALMEKYQKEGRYEKLDKYMPSVREVSVIKVVPDTIRGKYKVGQHWPPAYRLKMAEKIVKREGVEKSMPILDAMRIRLDRDGTFSIEGEPVL